MKILTIGGATQDIFIQYQESASVELTDAGGQKTYVILPEGGKLEVSKVTYSTGGGATNAGISLKRLGHDVSVFTKIGNDYQGERVIAALASAGMPVASIVTTDEHATGISFIIPTPKGNRTVLAYRGANAQLQEDEIPFDAIAQADCLYITSLSGDSSHLMLPITQFAQSKNIRIINNPGSSQLKDGARQLCDSLGAIDVFILNTQEAQTFWLSLIECGIEREFLCKNSLTPDTYTPKYLRDQIKLPDGSCFDIRQFCKTVMSRGPSTVVVTDGADGVYVAHGNDFFYHPALPAKINNTLGAGDAFGSAFAASLMKGDPVERALRIGLVNATSVISYLDAKQGLLTDSELQKRLREIDPELLQKYLLS